MNTVAPVVAPTLPSTAVWLTVEGAAARAAVSESTIRREIRAGRLRYARIRHRSIRIKAEWLDEMLEASAEPVEVIVQKAKAQ